MVFSPCHVDPSGTAEVSRAAGVGEGNSEKGEAEGGKDPSLPLPAPRMHTL